MEEYAMNIQPRPDQEPTIREALKAGLARTETEVLDIGLDNLRARLAERQPASGKPPGNKRNNLVELFDSVKGDDLDFDRNPSTGRTVDL
jgi:hypothetical protein